MNLTSADHLLAKTFVGPQPFEPANDAGRTFHILLTFEGGKYGYTGRFVDSVDASIDGAAKLCGRAGKVTVRPAIERTYLEGRARYPELLHDKAFSAAWLGWQDAHASRGAEVPTQLFVVRPANDICNANSDAHWSALRAERQREVNSWQSWPRDFGARL